MTTNAHQRGKTKNPNFSGPMEALSNDVKPLQGFIVKLNNDWILNLASIIAYNMLMAMLPIALALVAILSVFLRNSSIRTTVIHQITALFPGLAGQQNALDLASKQLSQASGILGIVAIVFGIFFGSFLFVVTEGCLDIVYRVRQRPPVRQFAVAIAMLLIFVILIPIMVFASAAPTIAFSVLTKLPLLRSIPGSSFVFISIGGILGGFITAFILFEIIYIVVPNQRISWQHSWRGAAFAALATEIFLAVFPFIIAHFFSGYAGPLGFAVILLLFFYYFSMILLVGGEINAFFFEEVRPIPNDIVTFVSTMAGKLNKDMSPVESAAHVDTKPTEEADQLHIEEAYNQKEK
ncbi:MAG: hypothetical protein NVS4B11_32710 [Ktedonobacteraceae bacterium]